MTAPTTTMTIDELLDAQACFAVASRLLYAEPEAAALAYQIAERQFSDVPYGDTRSEMTRAANALDAWCERNLQTWGFTDIPDATSLMTHEGFRDTLGALQREWLRLFAGVGAPLASCLESFYVEPHGHMFAPCTLEVRKAYARHGLQIEKLNNEPDDHLGLMLGFVSYLIGKEAAAAEEGNIDAAEALAGEEKVFMATHIFPWLAAWHYNVGKHATSEYYRQVGNFVFWLCATFGSRFRIIYDADKRCFVA